MELILIIAAGTYLAICAAAGGYVSAEKGRPTPEGILFGLFLGPFGVIAAACLPDRPAVADASEPGTELTASERRRVAEQMSRQAQPRRRLLTHMDEAPEQERPKRKLPGDVDDALPKGGK